MSTKTPAADQSLQIVLAEGEGQRVEFKRGIANLASEMVAFANAGGGTIYVGVDDAGTVANAIITNKVRSEIQDIALNCDPSITVLLKSHGNQVLEVSVPEGKDKPYRCKDGFFLRTGPNSQKLKRNEIRDLIVHAPSFHYDEAVNPDCVYPGDFDEKKFLNFLENAGIKKSAPMVDILGNLDLLKDTGMTNAGMTNAGVLFFAREPQRFLKESYCTCVRYQGIDRFAIIDRQDIYGSPFVVIDDCLKFIQRHSAVELVIGANARHEELFDYPLIAVREAIINAVMHRDYYYDGSHIYIHMFADRMEIENPGGLQGGLTVTDLGRRSVRRNRLIADILYRARYIERIGSGIERMRRALSDNNNPPFEIASTNFFVIRFFPRIKTLHPVALTARQSILFRFLRDRKVIARHDAASALSVSEDTVLRELGQLQKMNLIRRTGTGKATRYELPG